MNARISVPFVVLVASLTLSGIGAWVISTGAYERDLARFANVTQSAHDRLRDRLQLYIALLHSGVGLFDASAEVTYPEFRDFTDAIDVSVRYPGIQGIGFTRRMTPEDTAGVAAAIREYMPYYHVWPEIERPEIHSIVYLQPLDERNIAAIGYDMFTDTTRRAAMERARDTGEPALSGRVSLVQEIVEEERQAGFLIYAPVYDRSSPPTTVDARRASLFGFVYAPFRADDLFAGIFGTEEEPRVAFDVYDGALPHPEGLLHTSAVSGIAPSPAPQFADTVRTEIAGQTWTMVFASTTFFEMASRRRLVPLFAGLGVVVSFVLFGLSYTEMRSRTSAERNAARAERNALHAERLTRTLSEQAGALEAQVREVNALNRKLAEANEDLTAAHAAMREAKEEAERAKGQADEANLAKSRFLTKMSHELRTPLNAIAGYVDLLDLEVKGPLTDAQRSYIQRIRVSQLHLLGLINDVLSFAKLEVGRVEYRLEDFPLGPVFNDLGGMISPLAAAKGIAFRREDPPPGAAVHADREKLIQILLNLISNAVKFTGPGGTITLSGSVEDGLVRVQVADTGRGIPPDKLRAVFEPFVQVSDDLTREDTGTGLGLTIADELAHAMGGRLFAESTVGVGSTFTLELPPVRGGTDRNTVAGERS